MTISSFSITETDLPLKSEGHQTQMAMSTTASTLPKTPAIRIRTKWILQMRATTRASSFQTRRVNQMESSINQELDRLAATHPQIFHQEPTSSTASSLMAQPQQPSLTAQATFLDQLEGRTRANTNDRIAMQPTSSKHKSSTCLESTIPTRES